jgi:divalent metal cation (Fe/Co/Zn/Cd) transporter
MQVARSFSEQGEVDVVVHVEPMISPQETVIDQIHYLAELHGVHAHDIHVREVNGKLEADFDLEVQADMELYQAHTVATQLEQMVLQSNNLLGRVTTHLEAPCSQIVHRQDVTEYYLGMATDICRIADTIAGSGSAHDVHLYRPAETREKDGKDLPDLDLVLHTTFEGSTPLSRVHVEAEEIKRALRRAYPKLNSVTIHTEPPEQ